MLPRTLEPEVMDSPEEARDYDGMDHSAVNRAFVDDLLAVLGSPAPSPESLDVLDAGTGTARIPIELCGRLLDCRVTAIDLAGEMLKLARINVESAALDERVRLEQVDAKAMPYRDDRFDAVISNSIVHHVSEPAVVLDECLRVLRPGGILFLRDLLRPPDVQAAEWLVTRYVGDENQHAQQMFRDSLHAAMTVDEMRALLDARSLPVEWVRQTTDRHWTIAGVL